MPFWTEHNVFKNYLSRLLEYEEKNARRQEELRKELKEFMKAIQDFATTQTAILTDISSTLTAIAASIQGTTDPFTPADQAQLDAVGAQIKSIQTQAHAIVVPTPTPAPTPTP
jgi:esterase/lipase